jgi:hypothetical protein
VRMATADYVHELERAAAQADASAEAGVEVDGAGDLTVLHLGREV